MKPKILRLISNNQYKIAEAKELFSQHRIEILPIPLKISELQTTNIQELVRDKTLKAYSEVKRPLLVEHTGLYLDALNGFPGGLTQIFWDSVKADDFCNLFGGSRIKARTVIGFCDGKKIHFSQGEVEGRISVTPKGSRDFQWDCIFIPDGHEKTFAELGTEKNKISMRRRAIDNFISFLDGA